MQSTSHSLAPVRFADWFCSLEKGVSGSKVFLHGSNRSTYRQLFEDVRRLAAFFEQSGLNAGSRIVIASNDDDVGIKVFVASLCCGLTAVVLDPNAAAVELGRLVAFSDADMHFLDTDVANKLAQIGKLPSAAEVVRISDAPRPSAFSKLLGKAPRDAASRGDYHSMLGGLRPIRNLPAPADPGDTAYILFTSGTTTTPKGVEISYRGLEAQLSIFLRQYELGESSRILNLLPLHHADGLIQGPVLALAAGATVFRPFRFSVQAIPEVLDAIYRFRITHFIAVPAVLALIRDFGADYTDAFRTEDFRFIVSTAAFLEEGLWRHIEKEFAALIVNVYGLTETVCEALYCGPDDTTRKIGTVGIPIGCETKIVDRDGRSVGPGESGELLIRGDIVMKGYFRAPEETSAVLRDGWLHTGDISTADKDGFHRIVGRLKNVLIVGGINVYPEDMTNVILGMPGVRDAAVFGIEDKIWGEVPVACIVAASGHAVTEKQVREYFLTQSSQAMMPRQIFFLDDFPRGPAGKILLGDLKERIRQLTRDPEGAADATGIEAGVLRIAARVFKTDVDELSVETAISGIKQWDSLTHVEFLFSLEKEFGIRLSPREIFGLNHVSDAVSIIAAKRGHGNA